MKRVITILLALVFVIGIVPAVTASNGQIDVLVNGVPIVMDVPPIIINNRTMVPLRAICEALECNVQWDDEKGTALVSKFYDTIHVKINSSCIEKASFYGDQSIEIDSPAIIHNDRTMVPVRALSESLNAVVDWNAPTQTVTVVMEFDWIGDFYDGLAPARQDGKMGFINQNRDAEIPFEYDMVWNFIDDLALVAVEGEEHDIINEQGETEARKNNKYGFINKKGEVIVPIIYDNVRGVFNEGLQAVEKDEKWGFIDKTGEVVISFIYDYAEAFKEGLAGVAKDGKWGFIDKTGNVVVPFIYDQADSFENDKALVQKDGESFFIDKSGNRLD